MKLGEACYLLPGDDWIHSRDNAIVFLIYSVGLRISEALNLLVEDVSSAQFLTINGKGNKKRQVPLLPIVLQKIEEYKKVCPWPLLSGSFLFRGKRGGRLISQEFEKRVRILRGMLNLPDSFTPHSLRHSCATHLMEKSDDLRAIQELLGHKSLSSTQIYTKVSDEKMKETYQEKHPRAGRISNPDS
jgi:integrase/recombinase XerC